MMAAYAGKEHEKVNKRKVIKIEWQRLIVDKETCPRCGSTEQELEGEINVQVVR